MWDVVRNRNLIRKIGMGKKRRERECIRLGFGFIINWFVDDVWHGNDNIWSFIAFVSDWRGFEDVYIRMCSDSENVHDNDSFERMNGRELDRFEPKNQIKSIRLKSSINLKHLRLNMILILILHTKSIFSTPFNWKSS